MYPMSTKKIYTNAAAQIAGKIATAMIAIFLIKILTIYLGLDGRGIYDKIYTYLSIFSVIADMGLYTISVREMAKHTENPKKMEQISGNILSLRLMSGVGIILLSLLIAIFLPGYSTPLVLSWVGIVAFFTLFGIINSSIMSYLQAILKTEFSFIANVSGKLLTFVLICLIIWILPKETTALWYRLTSVLFAGLAGNILMTVLTFWYASRFQKIRLHWDKNYIIKILKLSLPYWVALFLGAISLKVDIMLLSTMESQNIANKVTALYALPMKIVEVGMMYGTIFLNSLLPVLTTAIEDGRHHDSKKLSAKGFELLMGFGAGISVFLAFFADKIVPFIASYEFLQTIDGYNSADVMRVVAWIFLFYFVSSLANYILIARNDQKKIIFVNLFIATFNLVGNIIVIPTFSFMGAAYITIISQILLLIISLFLVKKDISVKMFWINGIGLLFGSLFAGYMAQIFWKFIITSSLFVSLLVSGTVFVVLFLGFWFLFHRFFSAKVSKNIV